MKMILNIIWSLFLTIITYRVVIDLYSAFVSGEIRKIRATGVYLIGEDLGMFIFIVLLKVIFLIVLLFYLFYRFKDSKKNKN